MIFPGAEQDPGVHPHYQEFFQSGRLKKVYLGELVKGQQQNYPLNVLQIITAPKDETKETLKKVVAHL